MEDKKMMEIIHENYIESCKRREAIRKQKRRASRLENIKTWFIVSSVTFLVMYFMPEICMFIKSILEKGM